MRIDVSDGEKLFRKLGTCSRTFFYIINREFDNPKDAEERAADPLAGGIFKQGYQCGMLWGASEVVKNMGASDEEMVMAAGFAGGLGLYGNACGALSAAIWMNTLDWCKKNDKSAFKHSNADEIFEKFYAVADYEILCKKITETEFKSVADHTGFIKNAGCEKLINELAQL